MEEIWKDIKGYEGLYKVSNLGRVKSLSRMIPSKEGSMRMLSERILKHGVDRYGYRIVSLTKDYVAKTKKIHKLVAIAFLGHVQNGYEEVIDHINTDKQDNRVENLQITNQRHNTSRHIKQRRNPTSQYMGVSWANDRNKWRAAIYINGKSKNLGRFHNEIDAANAYQKALKEA